MPELQDTEYQAIWAAALAANPEWAAQVKASGIEPEVDSYKVRGVASTEIADIRYGERAATEYQRPQAEGMPDVPKSKASSDWAAWMDEVMVWLSSASTPVETAQRVCAMVYAINPQYIDNAPIAQMAAQMGITRQRLDVVVLDARGALGINAPKHRQRSRKINAKPDVIVRTYHDIRRRQQSLRSMCDKFALHGGNVRALINQNRRLENRMFKANHKHAVAAPASMDLWDWAQHKRAPVITR